MLRAGATDVDVGPSTGRKGARVEEAGKDVCFLLASVSGARQSVGKMFDEAAADRGAMGAGGRGFVAS